MTWANKNIRGVTGGGGSVKSPEKSIKLRKCLNDLYPINSFRPTSLLLGPIAEQNS